MKETKKLKKLESNLNNYSIVYESNNVIVGQINRIFPKNVITDPSIIKLIFKEESFTKIQSDENIEIGEHFDILFLITKEYNVCFTKNNNYIKIFDINEQYEEEACYTISKSNFINYCDDEGIEAIIKENRIIQKMLNNEIRKKGFENFEWETFEKSIKKIDQDFSFKVENKMIILDENDKSNSLEELIKVVGYGYAKTLNSEEIMEVTPKKLL